MSNDISTGIKGGYAPAPLSDPAVATPPDGGARTDTTGQTSTVDATQILAELGRLASAYKGNATGGATGISNANGAPEIGGVQIPFSPEDLTAALQLLQNKTKDGQLATAKEDLVTSRNKMDASNKASLAKIDEWAQKCRDAAEAAKTQKILGWVTAGVGLLAAAVGVVIAGIAVAAAILTGGALAPVACAAIGLVVALIGVAAGGIAMTSCIVQECGGPPIELSKSFPAIATKILVALGMPEEQAKSAGKLIGGAVGVFCTAGIGILLDQGLAGEMVGGLLEVCGVSPETAGWVALGVTIATTVVIAVGVAVLTLGAGAASGASNAAGKVATTGIKTGVEVGGKVAETSVKVGVKLSEQTVKVLLQSLKVADYAAKIINGLLTLTQGATTTAKSGVAIHEAVVVREGAQAQIDKKKIDAIIVALMKGMEENTEEIKKLMKQMEEGLQLVSDLINGRAQLGSQMTANLGGARATV